jgi:hypothetical protein
VIYVNEIIYILQINFNILDSIILAMTYLLFTLLVKCVRGSWGFFTKIMLIELYISFNFNKLNY